MVRAVDASPKAIAPCNSPKVIVIDIGNTRPHSKMFMSCSPVPDLKELPITERNMMPAIRTKTNAKIAMLVSCMMATRKSPIVVASMFFRKFNQIISHVSATNHAFTFEPSFNLSKVSL